MPDPTGVQSHLNRQHRGIAWKEPCRVATTATITISTALNSGDTIDGVTLADGDRVLVKDQTSGAENGIYVAGTTPTRAYDMDQDGTTSVVAEEIAGAFVWVIAGTANAQTLWYTSNVAGGTLGSTTITWVQWAGGRRDIWIGPYNPADFTQTGAMTAANYAFTAPFNVGTPRTVVGARTYIAVSSGNLDVGIYATGGARLASTGTTACPAAGERTVTFTAPVTLYPGRTYYLAFAASNTTVSLAIRNGIINTSAYEGIGSLPLPATLTIPSPNGALENFMWVLTE